jgi:mono/diheme cytochrome c family protein
MSAKFLTAIALAAFALMICGPNDAHAGGGYGSPIEVPRSAQRADPANGITITGRKLFLKNCAQCHGADAHGDDGPDLHDLGLADDWITNRIRKGKAGQMTAFAGKLQPAEIAALVAYVQSLK